MNQEVLLVREWGNICNKTNLKQISKGDKVSQLEEGKNKYEVYE